MQGHRGGQHVHAGQRHVVGRGGGGRRAGQAQRRGVGARQRCRRGAAEQPAAEHLPGAVEGAHAHAVVVAATPFLPGGGHLRATGGVGVIQARCPGLRAGGGDAVGYIQGQAGAAGAQRIVRLHLRQLQRAAQVQSVDGDEAATAGLFAVLVTDDDLAHAAVGEGRLVGIARRGEVQVGGGVAAIDHVGHRTETHAVAGGAEQGARGQPALGVARGAVLLAVGDVGRARQARVRGGEGGDRLVRPAQRLLLGHGLRRRALGLPQHRAGGQRAADQQQDQHHLEQAEAGLRGGRGRGWKTCGLVHDGCPEWPLGESGNGVTGSSAGSRSSP